MSSSAPQTRIASTNVSPSVRDQMSHPHYITQIMALESRALDVASNRVLNFLHFLERFVILWDLLHLSLCLIM